jgi:hypothetical protein
MARIDVLGHAKAMGDHLKNDLRDAQRCSIAVAFAKESALKPVDLEGWVTPERQLRLAWIHLAKDPLTFMASDADQGNSTLS